jgi:hypothetical protein
MRGMLLLIFNCLTCLAFSQGFYGSAFVPIPEDQTYSTEKIASFITSHFDTDKKKVSAIYSWVASNIKYDKDSANNINLGPDPEAKITAALRRRKGVCENFAAVFNDICNKAGITSFIVDGYTKQNNVVDRTGHSWCVVLLDGQWQLCDPTWDAGSGGSRWFLVQPSEMILTHMPYDPMWQLLEQPVTHRRFNDGYDNNKQAVFRYADTIAAWVKMDSLQRYNATAFRIQQGGIYNKLVRDRHEYTKMNIEIIREDRDVELYNAAVEDLNKATVIYNNFVQFRNSQFSPAIPDESMKNLLAGAAENFLDAHAKLDEIERSAALFRFSTEDIRNKLISLAGRVKEQNAFLNQYLATPKANRAALFYSRQGIVGK